MKNQLSFEQMSASINAVNTFECKYGTKFKAMIYITEKGSGHPKIFKNEDIFILRGQYIDHNMPFISFQDQEYNCAYTVIQNNDGCLTIKLLDKTIDILP